MRTGRVAAALGIVAFATAAGGQEPSPSAPATPPAAAPAPGPETEKLLALWDRTARELRDLDAPFTQERTLRIRRGRKEVSTGRFRYRRDDEGRRFLRWDYEKPYVRIEVLRPGEWRSYEPDLPPEKRVVEVLDLAAHGVRPETLEVLGQSAEAIRKAYEVSSLPSPAGGAGTPEAAPPRAGLRLVPRDETVRKHVASVDVLVDPESGLPREVTAREPRGDSQTFRFDLAAAKRNSGLAPELFVLAPPGVPVRPIAGGTPTKPPEKPEKKDDRRP
ncbi:MAG: outer membrane lipoprotein carrier protein LolA [Planctomycetales bacterium]|nr:outer membrane lipoprotein carrier protein LolA [Planctomycetales bacterium]